MDILHFWHCLTNTIKNHTFVSLTSGSENSLKYVTYVLEVRDDISEKNTIFTCFPIIVGNPNRKKMHIFGFVGIFEYIC